MQKTTNFIEKIYPILKKQTGAKNYYELPRLEKIVINTGIGPYMKSDKAKQEIENSLKNLAAQKPVPTYAKKSIAGFKIRENQIVGYKVTLRRKRAYDFLYKLINVILPRVRDFKGIPERSIDKNGNLTIGFKDAFVFPEVNREQVSSFFGLEICINFITKKREYVIALLKELGLPILK